MIRHISAAEIAPIKLAASAMPTAFPDELSRVPEKYTAAIYITVSVEPIMTEAVLDM